MPEVSRFFGIIIRMYFDDHPPPHFHAIYGNEEMQISIDPIVNLKLAVYPVVPYQWFLNGRRFINGN